MLQESYSRIYDQLKYHGFDGVGFSDSEWPEILLFNPSKANPLSAHWRYNDKCGKSNRIDLPELENIQKIAKREYEEEL
ncbi:MAG: hypothetical protein U9N54_09070 [candidate division Zixibacteria bacterium]|nr:hypothetical protein [candidate division Zixibacteria bacterium]